MNYFTITSQSIKIMELINVRMSLGLAKLAGNSHLCCFLSLELRKDFIVL